MKKTYKRYGEAFKHQVVSEYEAGVSVNSLQKKYDIRGSETIKGWIKKYAREGQVWLNHPPPLYYGEQVNLPDKTQFCQVRNLTYKKHLSPLLVETMGVP